MARTVLLFSGGLDSTTVLYHLLDQGDEVHCLGIDYGQAHVGELEAARRLITERLPEQTTWMRWQAPRIEAEPGDANVFPARNLMLVSLAAVWALSFGADTVAIGCNADDAADYLDCRSSYLSGVSTLLRKHGLMLAAPLLYRTKAQVVALARELGVPIDATRSCYGKGMAACGACAACLLREKALS